MKVIERYLHGFPATQLTSYRPTTMRWHSLDGKPHMTHPQSVLTEDTHLLEQPPTAVGSTAVVGNSTDAAKAQAPDLFEGMIGVLPLLDPDRDDTGHDPRSAYVETFWLPIVGPSTTLLMRRLADDFDAEPDGFEVDASSLSREIGLGHRIDARGSFAKTVDRCEKFHFIQREGTLFYVRRRLPSITPRQVGRLSPRLQALHQAWTIDAADDGAQRRTELVRAAHLARTLLALGESAHDAERQLHRWQVHPSIAWHAVQWAMTDPAHLS